jgi:hypothetical protein
MKCPSDMRFCPTPPLSLKIELSLWSDLGRMIQELLHRSGAAINGP